MANENEEQLMGSQTRSRKLTDADYKRMAEEAAKRDTETIRKIITKLDPKRKDPLGR